MGTTTAAGGEGDGCDDSRDGDKHATRGEQAPAAKLLAPGVAPGTQLLLPHPLPAWFFASVRHPREWSW
jgi:hypothetical protein